jgi:hypothetical protein
VRKSWRLAVAGMGATALAAGLVVAVMPASATGAIRHPAIQIAHSQRHVTAASCTTTRNYKGGSLTFTYCFDEYNRFECTIGSSQDIFGPTYAANGCSTQVNLYTSTTDKTPLCLDPERSTNVLKKDYEISKVTSRSGNCGSG